MTVLEFMKLFVEEYEQYFEIWDNQAEKIVFKGYVLDLKANLENATVTSIDNITADTNGITLNVDIE